MAQHINSQVGRNYLFIGYYDVSDIRSAPQVRIAAMINAFKRAGCSNVIVGNRSKRAWEQLKWIFLLRPRNITHAYIENSTSTAWPMDLLFLLVLKIHGIKIGIFIRDAYPAFHYFRSKLAWYQVPLYWGWHFSVKVYVKVANHIFLPTTGIVKFLAPLPLAYSALPPAMSRKPMNMFDVNSKSFLYLGGISELYGLENLANCLAYLKNTMTGAGIDFITREIPPILKKYENAEIKSLPYDEILRQDKTYLAGIIATHEPYSQFAVNIKLFDYLSLGLPVIITDMRGNAEIVRRELVGLIAKRPEDLPQLLAAVVSDPSILLPYQRNINASLYDAHSWKRRMLTIIKQLNGG